MNRRALLQSLGLAATHALFPSILANFVAGCQDPARAKANFSPSFFSREEFEVIREVIDVILPATRSKSASEVNTHHFLDEVFDKCMPAEQQALIKEGLSTLIPEFLSAGNKQELLTEIDRKAYAGEKDAAYFRAIKQYTLVGFFTSQEGMTVASNFVKFPGDYQGEIPSDENTLNYGKTNLRYYL
jgi:hypothetical protein